MTNDSDIINSAGLLNSISWQKKRPCDRLLATSQRALAVEKETSPQQNVQKGPLQNEQYAQKSNFAQELMVKFTQFICLIALKP